MREIEVDYDEEWLPVVGYEDVYEVSNYGNVKRIKRRKGAVLYKNLKPNKSDSGLYVTLRNLGNDKKFLIHRLEATAFIPNPENKEQVNHKDGNRWNNFLNNLEWNTNSENIQHSHNNLVRLFSAYGERHENSIPVSQYTKEGIYLATFGSTNEAGRALGIDFSNIAKCARGLRNHAGKYVWKYEEKEITVITKNPVEGKSKNLPFLVTKKL